MDFSRAMDYTIDKDEFWQLSNMALGVAGVPGEGHQNQHHHQQQHQQQQQRDPSDFFDQYVDMDGDETTHRSPEESFFVPLQEGGEDGMSGPAPVSSSSSGTERFLNTSTSTASTSVPAPHANADGVHQASCASPIPTAERSTTRSGSLTTSVPQRQSAARQAGQIAGTDNRGSTNHVVLGHLNAETIEQRRRLLSGRRGQDQPAGGSISDSELLKLEGLSVKSPRGLMVRTGPSSSTSISTCLPSTTTSSSITSADGLLLPPSSSSLTNNNNNGRGVVTATTTDDIDLCNLAKNGHSNFKSAGSRRLESIYATIRRTVGGHSRQRLHSQQQQQQQHHHHQQRIAQQQQQQQQQQPPPKTAPLPQTSSPSLMESVERDSRSFPSEGQLMWDGIPISPPLTDMNSSHHNRADNSAFVAGLMDDPFFDSHAFHTHDGTLGHAAQLNGKAAAFNANIPNTPLHTPNNLKTETATDDPSQYFPATTAGDHWSLGATSFMNSADLPHSTSFLSDSSIIADGWSFGDPPSSDSGSNNLSFGSAADGHSPSTTARNHNNLTIQVPAYAMVHDTNHTPSSETDHFGPGNALMIHMPQPRTPGSAPLLSSALPGSTHHPNVAGITDATGAMYTFPGHHESTPQHHHLHLPQQQQQHNMATAIRGAYTDHSHRRHKPRAPSSGARYHNQHLPLGAGATATLSPRKVRQPSSSSSSPSPTPHHTALGNGRRSRSMSRRQSSSIGGSGAGGGVGGSGGGLHHRKSANDLPQHGGIVVPSSDTNSHAIRKRRSISSWRGSSSSSGVGAGGNASSSRRNGSGSSSNNGDSSSGGFGLGISHGGGGGGGGSGGGAEIGFVNYTPDDHNVLMTGVAPSGSSKTKARREKEAMERQRKLSEAVVKAVTAAGVDVSRLKEEGIVI